MKTVRALIGVLLVAAVLYGVWTLVPVYLHNYELQDAMGEEARLNSYTTKSEEEMRDTLYRKAQDMDMPLTREQINVKREGTTLTIWADYTVHVDLPGYPLDLQFHPSSKNKPI